MYEQTEYLYAYLLVFACLLLGMLMVCIPRPRKNVFVDKEQAAKDKALKSRQKIAGKKKKKAEKAKAKKKKAATKKMKKK
ncbi:MAG: hypothetical protein P8J27_05610 [Mariniblastus sp.]|nr:hypothetical protein [Mariniblastus sp.]